MVHHGPQHAFFKGLGSLVKEKHVLPGFYHDTLGEQGRALAVGKARRFILRQFDNPPEPPTCAMPTAWPGTRDESDALARPLPRR